MKKTKCLILFIIIGILTMGFIPAQEAFAASGPRFAASNPSFNGGSSTSFSNVQSAQVWSIAHQGLSGGFAGCLCRFLARICCEFWCDGIQWS